MTNTGRTRRCVCGSSPFGIGKDDPKRTNQGPTGRTGGIHKTAQPVSRFMAFHKGVWRKHTLFIQDPLRSAAVPKPMHKLKRRRRHLSADFLVLSLTCCIGCDWGKPGSNYLRHQSLRWALVRGPCFSNRRPAFSPPVCQKASHGCQGVPQRGDFSQNSFAALFFLLGLGDLCSGANQRKLGAGKASFG